jgi:hypothetical protein
MLGGLMLGGPILVGSRGPALIMAACAASAISKAGTTASQASLRAQPLGRVRRSKDIREGRPESLRIVLSPSIGPVFRRPLPGHAPRIRLRSSSYGGQERSIQYSVSMPQRRSAYQETAVINGLPAFAGNDNAVSAPRGIT